MAGSRRDLFKRDNEKLQVYNPYMQGAQKPGDMQPLYNQKKGLPDENYHSPSMKGDRRMDAVVTTAGIVMPAGRMEEGIATAIGRIMPAIKKAGPKVMARFGNLLTKAKGNPEALTKIATKLDNEMGGMMLRPSQLQKSNPNYLDNINAVSDFKSRPVGELKDKAKIDAWLESKPAYERKAMGKPEALTKLAQELESKIPSYPQGIGGSRNIPSSAKQIEKLSAEYYAKNGTIDGLDDYIDLAIKQGKIKFNSPTTPEAIKARNIEEAFNKSNKPREYKYEDYDFSKPVDFGGVKYGDGPEPGTSLFTKKTRNPQEAYMGQFKNAKGDYGFNPEKREYTENTRLPKGEKGKFYEKIPEGDNPDDYLYDFDDDAGYFLRDKPLTEGQQMLSQKNIIERKIPEGYMKIENEPGIYQTKNIKKVGKPKGFDETREGGYIGSSQTEEITLPNGNKYRRESYYIDDSPEGTLGKTEWKYYGNDKHTQNSRPVLNEKQAKWKKQLDKLPEDIKKKYIKEYEQLKYEKQQDINRTDVGEGYGDYDDIEDAFDSDMAALNKKYGLSPFFDMGPDYGF